MYFTYTARHSKLFEAVVTLRQVLPVKDDLGSCWWNLGIALDLSWAELHNIEDDYASNIQKAYNVLRMWYEKEATAATMGRLADALLAIGRKDIIERLIGM